MEGLTDRETGKGITNLRMSFILKKGAIDLDASNNDKPFCASLLDEIIGFFHDVMFRVPLDETVEIIRFIEAANQSRLKNKGVVQHKS